MSNLSQIDHQNGIGKNFLVAQAVPDDDLMAWAQFYFEHEVTTAPSSRDKQRYAIQLFIDFMRREYGDSERLKWSPRVSKDYQATLQRTFHEKGGRRWSDRSIDTFIDHLKAFSKCIHKHAPFPLGQPMAKIKKLNKVLLNTERALTKRERNLMLDGADQLLVVGGRSKDRARFSRKEERPVRKDYRPYRNRAIIGLLIGSGMRRAAITNINLADINFEENVIPVLEKGGAVKYYDVSQEGMDALQDYLTYERQVDDAHWQSPALFLKAACVAGKGGRMSPQMVNRVWDHVRQYTGVSATRTPHSARHWMGKHIMDKTGNPRAVQIKLQHDNVMYSMTYTDPTHDEIHDALNRP